MPKQKTSKKKEASWDQIGKMVGKKIEKECKDGECAASHKSKKKNIAHSCTGGGIYFVGFVGALVYYISTATGFWNGAWGVIKALFWPAFLVYELLKFLGM